MSTTEIIEQIKILPAAERAEVARFIVEHDDSWLSRSRQLKGFLGAGRYTANGEASILGEDSLDEELNVGVILDDDENLHPRVPGPRGRRTTKHAPWGTLAA